MRLLHLPFAVVLLLPAFAVAAESDKEASDIVDRAIAAHGGADVLAKARMESWKAKGEMTMGGMSMKYNIDYLFSGPDRFRFDIDMEAGGMKIKLSVATDGKVAWEQNGPRIEQMSKEKQAEFHHNVYVMHLSQLLPLKDKTYTLASLGQRKFGEQVLVGIKVAREGRRDVRMYFDRKTGLLARTTTQVNDEAAKKEVVQETIMSDYRDHNGVKVFDKLTIFRGGQLFVVEEMSDQKMLDKVDEKLFAKPEK